MRSSFVLPALLMFLCCLPSACAPRGAGQPGAHSGRAGVAVYVGDEMIRPYRPAPELVTERTPVERARFGAVDVHCHWGPDRDARDLLAAMDERGIRRAVNLSGGWGERLDRMLDRYTAVAPDRLVTFCNIDFSRIDEPGFGRDMAEYLRRAHDRGARGLKVFKDLGLTIRDASGALVPVDDPRLDPIWSACGELGMPVLIHTADPAAFFRPVDERNERWMQLKRHPDWSFYGPEFPDRRELLAQRDRVLTRHPGTTFILAHLGASAENLAGAARVLDEHSNAYMDIAGRVAELGRQPYSTRRFLIRYQDRILFGTDRYPGTDSQPRHRIYVRFLETDDEYFDYYDHPFPPTGEWRIYGVHLPDGVLRRIYYENADRLLGFAEGS